MMAFLHSDLPPSTAPFHAAPKARAQAVALPARRAWAPVAAKVGIGLLAAALIVFPGYVAARETESLAIGILAGDLLFLLAVAGWSAVAGGVRR